MKHSGGCHCGKVRFEVEGLNLSEVISCNCSICGRKGHWLGFVPETQFTLIKGEKALTDYQFGKKNIHHLFCSTCGVGSFGKGTAPNGMKMAAINVRCLDDIDLDKITPRAINGKEF